MTCFLFVFASYGSDIIITAFNFIFSIIFFWIIYYCNSNNISSKNSLIFIFLTYSIFFIISFNILSHYYNNDFFVFDNSDAITYHELAIEINNQNNYSNRISYILQRFRYSDLGMPLVLSYLYSFVESNLILNFFYIIIGLYTALLIYKISLNFMNIKYSFLCSLSYSISSYTLWYYSSGLKEPFLTFLVLSGIYIFLNRIYLINKPNLYSLALLSISLILIAFFRPVVSYFLITAFTSSYFFKLKSSANKVFFIIVILFFISLSFPTLIQERNDFLTGGSFNSMLENRLEYSNLIKGGVGFSYFTNLLSSLFGPFPNFDTDKIRLSFFASGLVFKSFFGIFFILSLLTIIKNKILKFFPIMIFILLEIFGLILILEALELRKSMPHIPIFFILSFWYLYKLNIEGLKKIFF